jgi:hypothetical protein
MEEDRRANIGITMKELNLFVEAATEDGFSVGAGRGSQGRLYLIYLIENRPRGRARERAVKKFKSAVEDYKKLDADTSA